MESLKKIADQSGAEYDGIISALASPASVFRIFAWTLIFLSIILYAVRTPSNDAPRPEITVAEKAPDAMDAPPPSTNHPSLPFKIALIGGSETINTKKRGDNLAKSLRDLSTEYFSTPVEVIEKSGVTLTTKRRLEFISESVDLDVDLIIVSNDIWEISFPEDVESQSTEQAKDQLDPKIKSAINTFQNPQAFVDGLITDAFGDYRFELSRRLEKVADSFPGQGQKQSGEETVFQNPYENTLTEARDSTASLTSLQGYIEGLAAPALEADIPFLFLATPAYLPETPEVVDKAAAAIDEMIGIIDTPDIFILNGHGTIEAKVDDYYDPIHMRHFQHVSRPLLEMIRAEGLIQTDTRSNDENNN